MSRLAFQALMMWDDPLRFEDRELYDSVHRLLSILFKDEDALSHYELTEYQLLENIVSGSMDALSEAIKNNPNSELIQDLVEVLEDLIRLADEIKTGSPQ